MEFRHRLPIVGDVLEHVAAQDDVELAVVERQGCDVRLLMSAFVTSGKRGA